MADAKYDDFFDDVPDNPRQNSDTEEEDDEDAAEDEEDGSEGAQEEDEEGARLRQRMEAFDDGSSSDGDEASADGKAASASKLLQTQEKLGKKIRELEDKNVGDKPWQLTGEVSSRERPVNSLLEATLEFEHATRTAPVVTEEHTESLEEMIKRRIRDANFDDVIRKYEVSDGRPRATIELDTEKSKKGLGEIYEDEYRQQAMNEKPDDVVDARHKEIEAVFKTLCHRLDALANLRFTPKEVVADLSVRGNHKAIAMEEVLPENVSSAATLAPEEVFAKDRKELKGDSETTQEERAAMRRARKNVQRIHRKEKETRQKEADAARTQPLSSKYAKKRALDELAKNKPGNVTTVVADKFAAKTNYSSSAQVFKKLQNDASGSHSSQGPAKKSRKHTESSSHLKM